MKKVICLLITVVMLVQCAGVVSAQELPADRVFPNIDMEVRKNGAGSFENGPLNLSGDTAVVDYRTTLYMDSVLENFEDWYEKAEEIIGGLETNLGTDFGNALRDKLNNLVIEGEFTVEIMYPDALIVPQNFINGGNMFGFGFLDETNFNYEDIIFYEKDRSHNEITNTITITIGVKGEGSSDLKVGDLYQKRDTYLKSLTLTATGVTIPATGTYTVEGKLSGSIWTEETINYSGLEGLEVVYKGKGVNPAEEDTVSATVNLTKSGSGAGIGTKSLVFNIDGNTKLIPPINHVKLVKFEELPYPTKPAYTFDGWYYDSAFTKKVEGDVNVNGKVVLYGHFVSNTLDSEDHFAYIIGYPDGTVRPSNYISREEVTTIFYRLLRESKTIGLLDDKNSFTDISADRWSCKAILSMANSGYVKGYEDGNFRPEQYITRAEFATMATRYAMLEQNKDLSFVDVNGHWAEEYINKAANAGWVKGYEDGSFGPEKYITRAEVMTIINRMLVRYVDEEGLHADTKLWTDMDGSEWYYYNVLEATNAHDYERKEDGKHEKWTEITPNKIWIELDEMENPDL